ncbi:conserved hypothetical protein [Crenothrix polyspora]|uniref:PIN domain-containing protein n=1 Tax=Crenothrix polyspora TaxID=360316 RepID=A0A1R4HHJ6_9GAMM|nr:PIN domain-containing protein [Crenothrix polyspora]SJM95695.1 conserved hypothetical protein [Crenothrix polyspora]
MFVKGSLNELVAYRLIRITSTLFSECLDVLSREKIFNKCAITPAEREIVFDAFLGSCLWVNIYFRWRPNLPDEADNHLIELAVAGNANYIITGNMKDFVRAELLFPELKIISASQFMNSFQEARS